MTIDAIVLDALSNAIINENALTLTGQLDRKLYESTNKVLEAAGGKWNRKAKAHLFDGDAAEIMDAIILTGQVTNKKSELGYFPTPKSVVDRLLELAEIEPRMAVLEPSAGQGAIAEEVLKTTRNVLLLEIDQKNAEILEKRTDAAVGQVDFLQVTPTPVYDRVVMNPPFARQVDIQHVRHAYQFLRPGGRLVSVMSAGVSFRTNKLTTEFRQFVKDHDGTIEPLPEGSFLESGTGMNTIIVTLEA